MKNLFKLSQEVEAVEARKDIKEQICKISIISMFSVGLVTCLFGIVFLLWKVFCFFLHKVPFDNFMKDFICICWFAFAVSCIVYMSYKFIINPIYVGFFKKGKNA